MERTFAFDTVSLATAISFGALQRATSRAASKAWRARSTQGRWDQAARSAAAHLRSRGDGSRSSVEFSTVAHAPRLCADTTTEVGTVVISHGCHPPATWCTARSSNSEAATERD